MVRLSLCMDLRLSTPAKHGDFIKETDNKLMAFTPEELERRRQRIYEVKPWLKSTGARTARGKAIVSQNALKHGLYSSFEPIRLLAKLEMEKKTMERIRAIVLKQKQAYENSNAQPHPLWQDIFNRVDDDDFLKELRNFKC